MLVQATPDLFGAVHHIFHPAAHCIETGHALTGRGEEGGTCVRETVKGASTDQNAQGWACNSAN